MPALGVGMSWVILFLLADSSARACQKALVGRCDEHVTIGAVGRLWLWLPSQARPGQVKGGLGSGRRLIYTADWNLTSCQIIGGMGYEKVC